MTLLPTPRVHLSDRERSAARPKVTIEHLIHANLLHVGQDLNAIRYDGQDAHNTHAVFGEVENSYGLISIDGEDEGHDIKTLVECNELHEPHIRVVDGWERIYTGITPDISLWELREFYLDKLGAPRLLG